MDTTSQGCWYTAQGTFVCRTENKTCKDEKTVEDFTTTVKPSPAMLDPQADTQAEKTKVYYKCNKDDDCMDTQLSCRVVPTTVNTNMKLCMPNGTHYFMQWPEYPQYNSS